MYNNHLLGRVVIIQKKKVLMCLQLLQLAHTNRFPNKQHLAYISSIMQPNVARFFKGGKYNLCNNTRFDMDAFNRHYPFASWIANT